MPPMYWSTGSHSSTALRVVGASLFHGSVKRAKYHDESTKVSIVSVSRRAGPPHCGQVTFIQVGRRSSGLPGLSNVTSSGSAAGGAGAGAPGAPRGARGGGGGGRPRER